jgi:2-oxoglutarate dehydrogenase complex dehydrogenase (E1) component-like enzyme
VIQDAFLLLKNSKTDFQKQSMMTLNKADVKTLVSVLVNSITSLPPKERKMNVRRSDCKNEQLFPLPVAQLKEIIAKYQNADDYVWAQEEPKNMGAYSFVNELQLSKMETGVIEGLFCISFRKFYKS